LAAAVVVAAVVDRTAVRNRAGSSSRDCAGRTIHVRPSLHIDLIFEYAVPVCLRCGAHATRHGLTRLQLIYVVSRTIPNVPVSFARLRFGNRISMGLRPFDREEPAASFARARQATQESRGRAPGRGRPQCRRGPPRRRTGRAEDSSVLHGAGRQAAAQYDATDPAELGMDSNLGQPVR